MKTYNGLSKTKAISSKQVWVSCRLPHGMKVIGTKLVYRNERDERGVVVRNKARLGGQGYTLGEGIDLMRFMLPCGKNIMTIRESKLLYGLHQAPRAWYATLSTFLEKHGYKRGTIDKTLFIKSKKTAITPMETKVALTKDEEADDVDVHLYRSMIGSLMYLTASRPDIMFAESHNRWLSIFLDKDLSHWAMQVTDHSGTSTTEAEYVAAANCCG
ncbi:putative ribonuclease H-like domain-containing protein [Tanacetum coccineum]